MAFLLMRRLVACFLALGALAALPPTDCESSACASRRATQPPMLMQVQAEGSKTSLEMLELRALNNVAEERSLNAATVRVVAHMRRFRASPANIVQAVKKGIEAVKSAFPLFMTSPPDVPNGISLVGKALLECIDLLLTEEGKNNWPNYDSFQQLWANAFEQLPAAADDIKRSLDSYSSSGNVTELIQSIFDILTEAADDTLDVEQSEIGKEIANYIDAVKDTFTFVGEAMEEFESGDIGASIETAYFGLKSVAKKLVPDEQQDDLVLNAIIGALDGVVGNISQDLLDFKQKRMNKNVCWKQSKPRAWAKPNVCPEGYTWDNTRHCWQDDCWQPTAECVANFKFNGETHASCTLQKHHTPWCSHVDNHKVWSHWSECVRVPCQAPASLVAATLEGVTAKKQKANGTLPATCGLMYPAMSGGWCHEKCPEGFEANRGKCWQICSGEVSADWPLMCGRDAGVLLAASVEMASAGLRAVYTAAQIAIKMWHDGVNATAVKDTTNMFIKLAKPFSYSKCSEHHMGDAIAT